MIQLQILKQKRFFVTNCSMLVGVFFAFSAVFPVYAQQWAGTYQGEILQVPAVFEVKANGQQVSGSIVANDYPYHFKGTASGAVASGTLTDGNNGATMPCDLHLQGNQLMVKMLNKVTRALEAEFLFVRGKAAAPATAKTATGQGGGDNRLVGTWQFTESYVSGDFSMATQFTLIIRADGTYLYGDGKTAGGSGAGSFNSGGGAGYTQGKWKTENGIIYADEGTGWQRYAQYSCDDNNLLFTFGNGNKQLWNRVR